MKIKKNVVWNDPRAEQLGESINTNEDAHDKIARSLSNVIAHVISDTYEDKKVIGKLLKNLITEQIRQYLREYDNVVAEDILKSMTGWKLRDFKIWESDVDWDNARHTKLSTFADEIAKVISSYEKNNQLQKVKENILLLNPDSSSKTDDGDGKIWLSNVLSIIDEELDIDKNTIFVSPGVPVKENYETTQTEIIFNDGLDDDCDS